MSELELLTTADTGADVKHMLVSWRPDTREPLCLRALAGVDHYPPGEPCETCDPYPWVARGWAGVNKFGDALGVVEGQLVDGHSLGEVLRIAEELGLQVWAGNKIVFYRPAQVTPHEAYVLAVARIVDQIRSIKHWFATLHTAPSCPDEETGHITFEGNCSPSLYYRLLDGWRLWSPSTTPRWVPSGLGKHPRGGDLRKWVSQALRQDAEAYLADVVDALKSRTGRDVILDMAPAPDLGGAIDRWPYSDVSWHPERGWAGTTLSGWLLGVQPDPKDVVTMLTGGRA